MTKIITNKPIAVDSLDHKHPYGVINDNNSAFQYIMEVKNYFKNNKISVLDLGCAGGQIIVDHHNLDDFAVGLEGSSNVLQGAGKHNWEQYYNKNLFLCDITEPFTCLQDSNETINFDYIQMWEVLEHIPENKLSILLKNIANHLSNDGLFCGSIATYVCPSGTHVSIFNKDKWKQIFKDNGFEMTEYIFKTLPRQDLLPHLTPNYRNGFVFTARKI